MDSYLLHLDDPVATVAARVGTKAARLARLRQAGLPVPPAFALTVEAYCDRQDGAWQAPLLAAYRRLAGPARSPVAVRSSATVEDLPKASLAGLQATVLNVREEAALLAAVRQVWDSLEGEAARAYRDRLALAGGATGVLVQQQVAAICSGVAFSRDPLTDEPVMVVEAISGTGERLVGGEADPQQWRIDRRHSHVLGPTGPDRAPLLDGNQLFELAGLVAEVVDHFGQDQDVEWAYDGRRFWLLQARPITTSQGSWFTDRLAEDRFLWSAAFLNERFTQPVSPLGWTLVATFVERLALRAPLELLGVAPPDGPLLKLWRGHPYSRVEAWQRLYKLFPDWLLPEDAARYFPAGDLSLRHAPREPVFGLRLFRNGLRLLLGNFRTVSPLHNPAAWRRYEARHRMVLSLFERRERDLARARNPIPAGRRLLREVHRLTGELLELHRWSLLYAELSYALLRRLAILRHGPEDGAARAARWVSPVQSPTTRLNRRLEALATRAARNEAARRLLHRLAEGEIQVLDEPETTPQPTGFRRELAQFLEQYGHRFFSLDLYDPPWEADRPAFARFLLTLLPETAQREKTAPEVPTRAPVWLRPLVRLTRDYLHLREAQRFHWQQLLALERRVILQMADRWVAEGRLATVEAIFGLTWQEVMAGTPDGERAAFRMARLRRLRAEAQQAPGWHYPEFLRGNRPLRTAARGATLTGRAISPGLVRGTARLIAHPAEFDRLRPGDILVTTSPDPGWTPVFGTVAALVTEHGSQLSHGAVVAREYGLPAVFGISGIMSHLREGEPLLVDGQQGIVLRLDGTAGDAD